MEGKQKVSKTQKRAVIRMALKEEDSARAIQAGQKLPIGYRRVQQVFRAVPYLKYNKMITAPQMTPQHKENRVKWCPNYISKGEFYWNSVVFSDEKKFNGMALMVWHATGTICALKSAFFQTSKWWVFGHDLGVNKSI